MKLRRLLEIFCFCGGLFLGCFFGNKLYLVVDFGYCYALLCEVFKNLWILLRENSGIVLIITSSITSSICLRRLFFF